MDGQVNGDGATLFNTTIANPDCVTKKPLAAGFVVVYPEACPTSNLKQVVKKQAVGYTTINAKSVQADILIIRVIISAC